VGKEKAEKKKIRWRRKKLIKLKGVARSGKNERYFVETTRVGGNVR